MTIKAIRASNFASYRSYFVPHIVDQGCSFVSQLSHSTANVELVDEVAILEVQSDKVCLGCREKQDTVASSRLELEREHRAVMKDK